MSDDEQTLQAVHKVFIGFNKRAERASESALVATFVDSAPLLDLLSTPNNQVISGRRGTGKTHALKFLAERVAAEGESSIYLDLRSVGSNGSIYSDGSRPLPERASTLVVDVLGGLYDELYQVALSKIDRHPNPEELTRRLDALQAALSTVRVSGEVETEEGRDVERKRSGSLGITPKGVSAGTSAEASEKAHQRVRRAGLETIHLTFGNISAALSDLLAGLQVQRLWLLLDEWSEIPIELQPYLGDLIRRTILPINEITIKIAAIEHRSEFAILKDRGEYIGLELGADVSADLNLDDFLVFDNSQQKATQFVKTLLYKHYTNSGDDAPKFDSADALIATAFTQYPAFEEFVRAVEGVPRDALNLAAKIATKGFGQKIAMNHVRAAARDWYTQDKAAAIRSNGALGTLLAHIVDRVIGTRRARAFLFPASIRHDGIEKLFDSRLLHILKKNISSHDQPGARFDVYKIDYGCYVDLINTAKAPEGLYEIDDVGFVEVPGDDYRSIRRAILDPNEITAPEVT